MRRLLVAVTLAVWATSAAAAPFVALFRSPPDLVFIDQRSIKHSDGKAALAMYVLFGSNRRMGPYDVRVLQTDLEFDCPARKYRQAALTIYDPAGHKLDGTVRTEGWTPTQPGSAGQIYLALACNDADMPNPKAVFPETSLETLVPDFLAGKTQVSPVFPDSASDATGP